VIESAVEWAPDIKDVQYLALAEKYGIPIWSNDKRLKNQSVVKVFSTEEIIRFIDID